MSAMTIERPHTSRSDRVTTIHEMLSRYNEARSEAAGGSEAGGGRSEARLLGFDPTTWTREFQELERCLDRLRWLAHHGRPMIDRHVSSGAAWWNVRARYLESVTVRREIHLRKTHSGDRVPAPLPRNVEVIARPTILNGKTSYVLVRQWDQRVDPQVVGVALRWISDEYRGTPASYSA